MPSPPAVDPPSDYRLSPALGARLVGLLVVGLAVFVFAATAAVALLNLNTLVLALVVLVVLAAVFGVGALVRGASVVHLDAEGYRVRLIRGAGVKSAPWTDVTEAATSSPRGVRCLVLRLSDGRTTTIPVDAVAGDRDAFVRDVRRRLRRGEGLRPLGGS